MRVPDTHRLVASVRRPPSLVVPYEWEYVLWFQIHQFPVFVRLGAYPPVPRA